MWSYWRSSVDPQTRHLPPSRTDTFIFTSCGMERECRRTTCDAVSTVVERPKDTLNSYTAQKIKANRPIKNPPGPVRSYCESRSKNAPISNNNDTKALPLILTLTGTSLCVRWPRHTKDTPARSPNLLYAT